jgi:mannose-1-phosphate guanylyltransferase
MMTEELIHSMDAEMESSLASPTSVHSKFERIQTGWGDLSIRTKQAGPAAQSAKLMDSSARRCAPARHASHHWGIVLAGGDGFRLRDVVKTEWGDDRPKQFCPLSGDRTLLDETRLLAERIAPPEQILYSVIQEHERYYRASLADRAAQTIVQPSNKGTAPAILSTLMHIVRRDSNAIVAILPCDHSYPPESSFATGLESAFRIAEQQSSSVVLLGLDPLSPEADCGWIEVGETVNGHQGLAEVKGLKEKLALPMAKKLFEASSLWNTFVMVGHVCTLLELAWATVPSLMQALESREQGLSPRGEIRIPGGVYDQIAPTDFTRQVLSMATERLLALHLGNVEWSDREDHYRELATLFEATGELPAWIRLWPTATNRISAAAA